jgi:acetoacetyl-CoA synthetase
MKDVPAMLWRPSPTLLNECNMTRYMQWLQTHYQLHFKQYQDLWQWSVDEPAAFWKSIWEYMEVMSETPYSSVLEGDAMPNYRWFQGATLNYAAHIFRHKNDWSPAIVFQNERETQHEISWQSLENQVIAVANFLKASGVRSGDRVAAFLPNTPHAIVAVLACMSIGAVWSSCSPDFGAASVADRFVQIAPKVLFAVDGYTYGGKSFDKQAVVEEIISALPSLEKIVYIPYLHPAANLPNTPGCILWEDILQQHAGDVLHFEALPFDHPLWVLYSSGTTGVPKAITHSHGGNLLEHLKYLHLHNDIRPGERFFWFATTGWMMWNFTLASMLCGATIVLYDGSPGFPSLNVLWELAEKAQISHFGTSAPYLVSCMKAGLSPKDHFKLKHIRSIGSTGSPLPPEAFGWVYQHIHDYIWLSSMAGGTDVCTAWVGGTPLLPVYQGEIQARCLGCDMESWDENGQSAPVGEVGEMVVKKPMPSMPVFFWNDADGQKYYHSYFDHFPGVWRHGDWIQITERNTVVILGRSDATLNRQGVRIGTAEIYRALDQIPDIKDALIVNLEKPDGSDYMPLFITLQPGYVLNEGLILRIKQLLRAEYSPRHVPDAILEAPDIPYTISGKKMETPVKKILQKKPLDKAFNADSMRNPEAMAFFTALAAKD